MHQAILSPHFLCAFLVLTLAPFVCTALVYQLPSQLYTNFPHSSSIPTSLTALVYRLPSQLQYTDFPHSSSIPTSLTAPVYQLPSQL